MADCIIYTFLVPPVKRLIAQKAVSLFSTTRGNANINTAGSKRLPSTSRYQSQETPLMVEIMVYKITDRDSSSSFQQHEIARNRVEITTSL